MDRLKDKVAIVTGSTSGIGIGIAHATVPESIEKLISDTVEKYGNFGKV